MCRMSKPQFRILILVALAGALIAGGLAIRAALHSNSNDPIENPQPEDDPSATKGDDSFATHVRPFVERYCQSCHGPVKREGGLDLSLAKSTDDVVKDWRNWGLG